MRVETIKVDEPVRGIQAAQNLIRGLGYDNVETVEYHPYKNGSNGARVEAMELIDKEKNKWIDIVFYIEWP